MLVTVNTSAFDSTSLNDDPPDDPVTHVESRWQVAESASFAVPLVDTWYTSSNLTSYTYEVPVGVRRYFRVQFRDSFGIINEWSEPLMVLIPAPPAVDVGGLYVACEDAKGGIGWSKWTLHESAEIIAIDAMDIPGRGPVLTLVVRRPGGVFIEHITLTEAEA